MYCVQGPLQIFGIQIIINLFCASYCTFSGIRFIYVKYSGGTHSRIESSFPPRKCKNMGRLVKKSSLFFVKTEKKTERTSMNRAVYSTVVSQGLCDDFGIIDGLFEKAA